MENGLKKVGYAILSPANDGQTLGGRETFYSIESQGNSVSKSKIITNTQITRFSVADKILISDYFNIAELLNCFGEYYERLVMESKHYYINIS